jgi:hypothetical protein
MKRRSMISPSGESRKAEIYPGSSDPVFARVVAQSNFPEGDIVISAPHHLAFSGGAFSKVLVEARPGIMEYRVVVFPGTPLEAEVVALE